MVTTLAGQMVMAVAAASDWEAARPGFAWSKGHRRVICGQAYRPLPLRTPVCARSSLL